MPPKDYPVGVDAAYKRLDRARAEGEVNTAFQVLPSNQLGGYGQYYQGSLKKLGLVATGEHADLILEGMGTRLAEPPAPPTPKPAVTLAEAWVQDEELKLRAIVPEIYANKPCLVVFQNNTSRPKSLPVEVAGAGIFKANVPREVEGQLRAGANIACLRFEEGGKILAESNPVLITNVQDFKTGLSFSKKACSISY